MSCNFLRICTIILTCEILYILAFIFRFLLFSFIICIMLLNSFTIFCCFKFIFFYKSEVKLLSLRRMECPLQGIAVSFSWTREGRSARVTGRLVQRLQWANVVVKWGGCSSKVACLPVALWSHHEFCLVTNRIRWIQVAEKSFCRMESGLSLTAKVRNLVNRERLKVKPLLIFFKRSQLI